ncbi:MAG: hypothetical protein MZV64_59045 [Ignavibacteriales bacterium]|nr:hypothetical protein [Ignavibacteriales bacterium]
MTFQRRDPARSFGLLGSNGAGKTTTVRLAERHPAVRPTGRRASSGLTPRRRARIDPPQGRCPDRNTRSLRTIVCAREPGVLRARCKRYPESDLNRRVDRDARILRTRRACKR